MFSLTLHPMQPPEITLAECSKRFGERLALRKATLTVAAGETVVVLGPNGAGKSTLLRLVAGLLRPTAGSARIGDVEAIAAPKEVRAGLAYAGHQPQLYRGLTARENIDLHLRLHQTMADTSALLERVGLADRADERIDGFSRGMLQRLALARATAHDPVLLLLDEPASGLDADGRALLDETLRAGIGSRTQLVASHDHDLAERLGVREIRRREVIFAMLLFLAATIVIVRVALSGDTGAGTRAAAGMLWAAVVFTAVLGLLRTFAAEHEGGVIDALLLAPIDRASIWLGTALAQFGFLTAIELVAVPVWWALFFQGGGPSVGTVVVALLLANVGIALVGTLSAALALGARPAILKHTPTHQHPRIRRQPRVTVGLHPDSPAIEGLRTPDHPGDPDEQRP